jgi:DNA-binding winged helix-turn-helix (wHTH) protein
MADHNLHSGDEPAELIVGQCSVFPHLNRLSREGTTVQLEPKMMEVLIYLARRAESVCTKREILDTVWPEVIVTEAVLSRAVAGLRRALGDNARNPAYIETITRRGYRLIAPVASPTEPKTVQTVRPPEPQPTPREQNVMPVPYVVGQWVRGERFYGRSAELAEVLDAHRRTAWVLGTRRVGKTSFLRQLELITESDPSFGVFPLYWDLQGCGDPDELHLSLEDALLDVEQRLDRAGLSTALLDADDVFGVLSKLRQAIQRVDLELLLLCDEAEELISLNAVAPKVLPKLRRVFLSSSGVRTVLTSGNRLWALAEQPIHTSPFLDGFLPPMYLGPLPKTEAKRLLLQTQLPQEFQPHVDASTLECALDLCGNHPYLIQLFGKRLLDHTNLEAAHAAIVGDRSVTSLFSVDFGLLGENERHVMQILATGSETDLDQGFETELHNLIGLGLVRRDSSGRPVISNAFLRHWLETSI